MDIIDHYTVSALIYVDEYIYIFDIDKYRYVYKTTKTQNWTRT